MSFVLRQPYISTFMPFSPPRKAWAICVPAGRPTTWPARIAWCCSSLPRSRDLGLGGRRLLLPGMATLAGLDPRREQPREACTRKVRRHHARLPAVCEHVEPLVAGPKRVLLRAGPMDDAVACPYLVDLAVLPRETRSGQDEEDLLVLDMRRRRPLPGVDLDAVDRDLDASRGTAERPPAPGEVTLLGSTGLDLVPVDEPAL